MSEETEVEPPRRIKLVLCQERSDFRAFRGIIDRYHTYKPWKRSPGRKICWLIESADGDSLGATAVHSAVLTIKARDTFIGWTRQQKLANLVKVANNYRFALKVRGIGSQVLGKLEREAPRHWRRRYDDPLVLLETFVQPPYAGTSYKAANWTYLGMTAGFAVRRAPVALWKRAGGERARLFQSDPAAAAKRFAAWNKGQRVTAVRTEPKLIFVRPLHRYWRRELLRDP